MVLGLVNVYYHSPKIHYRLALWIKSILVLGAISTAAAQDPREIVRRSLELDRHNDEVARNYTFLQRTERRDLDAQSRVKSRTVTTYDITLLEGSPYRRLVQRNDKPLSPAEEKREEEKLRKSIEERRKETGAQRAQRVAEWQKGQQRRREFLREVPDAFDFRLVGEERLAGRDVYVIKATPRPGYRPTSRFARFLPKLKAQLWIDKQEYEWVKADVEVIDTISLGWFLARIQKGTRLVFEQARVNDEVWLPKRVEVTASARLALLKKFRTDLDITFSNYRKFQADSRITDIQPKP